MTPATAAMIMAAAMAVRALIGSPASAAPSKTAISGLTNALVDARVGIADRGNQQSGKVLAPTLYAGPAEPRRIVMKYESQSRLA